MPIVKVTGLGVTLQGLELEVGTEIEISEKSAASLVENGHAEAVTEAKAPAPAASAKDDAAAKEKEAIDEVEKQFAALDSQYKRDDLAAAAKELGVDFAFNAKKDEIIAAVIEQGFAQALIK